MNTAEDIEDLLKCDRLRGLSYRWVDAMEIEHPYRALLCHHNDMTSTLAKFHGGEVSLRVFQERSSESVYVREVLLSVGEKPVEYGFIKVYLENFPVELRERILAGKEPLGAILNESGLPYVSKPRGLIEITDSGLSEDFFPSAGGETLFGRYNCLLDTNGRFLARIIEILPREKS